MTLGTRFDSLTHPRRMLVDLLGLTLVVWAVAVLIVAAIIAGIAVFGTVSTSLMSEMAAGIARFYAAFIGFYVARYLLPQYVTHGRTRREFSEQATVAMVIFAVIFALLVSAAFALEYGLYRLADWPQEISDDHLYNSGGQLHLIFLEHLLVFLVWTAAGALIGAGFYRSDGAGLTALPLALIPIAATGIALGDSWGPLGFVLDRLLDPGTLPIPAVVAVALASFALALAMTWPIVRDVPIRSQTA
jgi:hypothetical protein